jgi:hypothetical protein
MGNYLWRLCTSRRPARRAQPRRLSPQVEALEARYLLNATVGIVNHPTPGGGVDHVLEVHTDQNNGSVIVSHDGAHQQTSINLNGNATLWQDGLFNSISIDMGAGNSTVIAHGTGQKPLTVNIGGKDDLVKLGGAFNDNLQDIGPVTLTHPDGFTGGAQLFVDGWSDTVSRTVSVENNPADASFGQITGLTGGTISYQYSALSGPVILWTGQQGMQTVNVRATGVGGLSVYGANATVNVGNAGSLTDVLGPLTVSYYTHMTLNVDDSADPVAHTFTLDTTPIGNVPYSRVSFGNLAIQYRQSGTDRMTLDTGSGGATVNVLDTGRVPTNLVGNPAGVNTLVGPNVDTSWTISGANAGSTGSFDFSGFQNLQGGTGNNTFFFADGQGVSGTITGGGGVNTLNYYPYRSSVVVDLQTNTATGVGGGVFNIQNVMGGNAGGAGVYNILIGNGGNVLTGGYGRPNLLIAGGKASTLKGGNADDILIGGTTGYDTEAGLTSLQAVMDYWSTTADNYATRVANLTSGNGVPLLDASTVTNNGGGNTMLGYHGGLTELNLFYGLDPALETTDYNPNAGEQFIRI